MKKCDCYKEYTRKASYTDFELGMYFAKHNKLPDSLYYTKIYAECNGTKKREECTCGGDIAKCNFYDKLEIF